MKRILMLVSALLLTFGLMAGPALADHDHHMENPSGCRDIPVGHQAHGEDDPGRKFHGAAHKGPATDEDGRLGKGNSPNTVSGGSCS